MWKKLWKSSFHNLDLAENDRRVFHMRGKPCGKLGNNAFLKDKKVLYMDYQGNYFSEDHDENESKVYKVVKGTFKWTMYGLSFLVYAILFFVLIVNRDSDIIETNYLHEISGYEYIDTDKTELIRINTREFMNDDGSIQLHNIDYHEQESLIEIGVKFNANKHTSGEGENTIRCELYDSEGNRYELKNEVFDEGGRYGFMRVAFRGTNIDLDSNDLRYDEDSPTKTRTNVSYKLDIIRVSDNETLHTFEVYNNKTTFNKTDYND